MAMSMESRKEHKNNIACVWAPLVTHTDKTAPSLDLHMYMSFTNNYRNIHMNMCTQERKRKQDHQLRRIYV